MVQTEYFGEGVNFEGIPDTFFSYWTTKRV